MFSMPMTWAREGIDLSFVPQIDKMPSDITELLAMPKVTIPDSIVYDYIVQTQNIGECNLGLEIHYSAYATFKVGERVFLIYEADSLFYGALYICEIIPGAMYPPNLIIATKPLKQFTGFLSNNNVLSVYSVQGNIEYHYITESVIDLRMGLRHYNEIRTFYDNPYVTKNSQFGKDETPVDTIFNRLIYPSKPADEVRSHKLGIMKVNNHTYDVVGSWTEYNSETLHRVFLYEPKQPISDTNIIEIYSDLPYGQIDFVLKGDTINIIKFQMEDSWMNPVKYSIDLAP